MSPQPTSEGMRRFWDERGRENAAWYVDTSLDYDEPDMAAFWATGETIVSEALLDAPVQPAQWGTAVEIGCGLGRICKALRQHFDRVIGIDIAPSMVEQAAAAVPDDGVSFQVGDGESLAGIADESVDFLVTFTVFQHQPTTDAIAAYLAEAGRVLRPGGVLAAQWNNIPEDDYRQAQAGWRRQQRLSRVPVLGRRFQRRAHDDRRLEPQFQGTTASTAFMVGAAESAGLSVAGTKGEGTLFAWLWASKP